MTRPGRRTRSNWPAWACQAAAAWSLLYGMAGLYWTLGGAAFPFGVRHDPDAARTMLEQARPETLGPLIAAVGFAAATLAMAMSRGHGRGITRAVLAGGGWLLSAALTLVIPDGRPLMAVARLPLLLVGLPFGWPSGVSLFDRGVLPWPVLNQLILMLGGLLWALATLAYRRRTARTCPSCGRADSLARWTTPEAASRWGRWAVAVAVVIPLFYASVRLAWFAGIPFGVTSEFLTEEARDTPDIWLAGAMEGLLAIGGAVLTLGLVQRWGEVYPRWIPGLRGRPVKPRTAIVPASVVAVLVTSGSISHLNALMRGYFPERLFGDNWGTILPGTLWPLWGVALGAAALAYHFRRRGTCARCHRA
ncbi:hypothetical protein [Nonomuraea sp. NPDC048916]|uniref:hypothetical protein n=1 Tax=Nonomuraea sp. NPDC048916 TaxID=3154232 RepID=UPI0033CF7E25